MIILNNFCSQVPIEFTIGQTFEMFYKLHKIFKMTCDPNLDRLFKFFDYYIFEIGDYDGDGKRKFRPTAAMQLLYENLLEV